MREITTLFALFFVLHAAAAEVDIRCENAGYAGQKLDFYAYADPVTLKKELAFSLHFDQFGECSQTFDAGNTLFVFSDFGIYRGMLFVEPAQTIDLKLPPVREKSFADRKNPYFKPVSFWLATENDGQLNTHIANFNARLNQLTDKYFNQLYFRGSQTVYDSVLLLLDREFGGIASEDFQFHKTMKLKLVETDIFRLKTNDYASVFANLDSRFWLRPSFIELFAKAFNSYLGFEAKTMKGEAIRNAVNRADVPFFAEYVQTRFKLKGDIADLVLLKMMHDAFYSGEFSKMAIQKMVGSAKFLNHGNKLIKATASNISSKFSHLQVGSMAPAICLPTLKGENICTNSGKDKFKYIVFADAEMAVSREHLKYLPEIAGKFPNHLEIFIVLRKTDSIEMKKFFAENEIPGAKMIDGNGDFTELFKVKSFPQSFLLDENHRVVFETAKNPLEGFEQQFGAFLQRELFERQAR